MRLCSSSMECGAACWLMKRSFVRDTKGIFNVLGRRCASVLEWSQRGSKSSRDSKRLQISSTALCLYLSSTSRDIIPMCYLSVQQCQRQKGSCLLEFKIDFAFWNSKWILRPNAVCLAEIEYVWAVRTIPNQSYSGCHLGLPSELLRSSNYANSPSISNSYL